MHGMMPIMNNDSIDQKIKRWSVKSIFMLRYKLDLDIDIDLWEDWT